MIFFQGFYRLRPRRLAFRNDYCRSCEDETVSYKVRTFNILQINFIPVFPVGFGTRWICSRCDGPSHVRTRTSRVAMWLAALIMLALTAGVWLGEGRSKDEPVVLVTRIVMPVATLLVALSARRAAPLPKLSAELAAVQPSTATACPVCHVPLIEGENWSCPECGMVRSTGDVAVQTAYESVQRRQVLAYAVLFALLLWLGLSPFSAEKLLVLLPAVAFLVFNNRCPSCEHAPGGGWHPRACSACGIQLR